MLPAALLGAAAVACAWALYRCYAAREKHKEKENP